MLLYRIVSTLITSAPSTHPQNLSPQPLLVYRGFRWLDMLADAGQSAGTIMIVMAAALAFGAG
jgi:hypothetical protein